MAKATRIIKRAERAHYLIVNLDAMPKGTGARYLEVITSHISGVLIAKQWRKAIVDGAVLLDTEA